LSFRFCERRRTDIERCTWKAKYPTQEAIDQKRQELGDIGFRREMLLQVVPEEGQDVLPEDIHYYDDPPFDDGNYLAHGVDLAISTKESADYTVCEGQAATVLQLPARPMTAAEADAQKRVNYVG
jgi:hypothetical protein